MADFKIMMTQMGGETFSDEEFEKMVEKPPIFNIRLNFRIPYKPKFFIFRLKMFRWILREELTTQNL